MAKDKGIKTELSRDLTLFQLVMMGLGMMIGAGVFLGIGNAIFYAGPGGVLLTFAFNGLLALFTAMSYAELSSAIPRAGGAYNFTRIGFGKQISFQAGWMEWFASSVAGSMYAITFSLYTIRYLSVIGLLEWLPDSVEALAVKIFAVLIALFFLFINYLGVAETGKVGVIMTVGQTGFLIFIGVAGLFVVINDPSRLENFTPFLPNGWGILLVTMGFTYVAFEGFEVIAQAGDEAITPKKNLPKAMIISVSVACLTYILVSFASIVAIKADWPGIGTEVWKWIGSYKEKGFGEAISYLIPFGNFFLTLAVIFASTSALNATVFSATRSAYALGRDKMLPNIFARISVKRKTPWGALFLTGVIVFTVIAFLPTMDVASCASIMFIFIFFIVNISVIKIRWNLKDELTYGYLMPLFPIFPVLAIILQVMLAIWLVHMSLIAWIAAPLWIITGFIIYHTYSKKRTIVTKEEIQVIEENAAPKGDEYRVLIPVANTDNALHLAVTTTMLMEGRKSRIKILHMVEVPEQLVLADAEKYMVEGKKSIIEAAELLRVCFPITTTIRYCRNVARGIIFTAKEKKVNLLIMGWRGKRKNTKYQLGSTLDPVITKAPCDVIVLKDSCKNKKFYNIIIPIFGTDNDMFALQCAKKMMAKEGGSINLFYFANRLLKPAHINNLCQMKEQNIKIRPVLSNKNDIVKAILDQSKKSDLLIIGMKESRLMNLGIKSDTEQIAEQCAIPFILVKRTKGFEGFFKRWL